MTLVPLVPIGSPLSPAAEDHRPALAALEDRLRARRDEVEAGWGPKYVERVHAKGKLTARERVLALIDPGTTTREVGTFVNYGHVFPGDQRSPAAGVVTALGVVAGRWCMIIANDNTVASGAWWPRTPEKIQRAQQMALRLRLPTIYLVDCSGLFLPEQSKSFPGATRRRPHLQDEQPAVGQRRAADRRRVRRLHRGRRLHADHQRPRLHDRAGVHGHRRRGADQRAPRARRSRRSTSAAPRSTSTSPAAPMSGCRTTRRCWRACAARSPAAVVGRRLLPRRAGRDGAAAKADELGGLLPVDHREVYDAHQVLARLVDQSLFWEVMPEVGEEMICGVGRVGGLYAGLRDQPPGAGRRPERPGHQRPPASCTSGGIAKISAFSRACNDDGIPLIWLQDISGFDIGARPRPRPARLRLEPHLHQLDQHHVPMFTVLLRKASGAGYYAMAGLPYDPIVQLSTTPVAAVGDGGPHAGDRHLQHQARRRLPDRGHRTGRAREDRGRDARGRGAHRGDMDPFVAARQMDTDEIVELGELRGWLADAGRDGVPEHRLPPGQEPADLVDARPRELTRRRPR
jgi:3-methylcrotonyl-CoA carboxylase beta subunit